MDYLDSRKKKNVTKSNWIENEKKWMRRAFSFFFLKEVMKEEKLLHAENLEKISVVLHCRYEKSLHAAQGEDLSPPM